MKYMIYKKKKKKLDEKKLKLKCKKGEAMLVIIVNLEKKFEI